MESEVKRETKKKKKTPLRFPKKKKKDKDKMRTGSSGADKEAGDSLACDKESFKKKKTWFK